jgi:hypothetical protein
MLDERITKKIIKHQTRYIYRSNGCPRKRCGKRKGKRKCRSEEVTKASSSVRTSKDIQDVSEQQERLISVNGCLPRLHYIRSQLKRTDVQCKCYELSFLDILCKTGRPFFVVANINYLVTGCNHIAACRPVAK